MVQLSTHQWIFRVAVLMTTLCSCAIGLADALNVFTSEADFLAAAPVVSTETFEEFTPPTLFTSQIMIGDVVYTGQASWSILEAGYGTGNALISNVIGVNEMSFGPGQFAHAIGFFLLLPGASPVGTFLGWQIVVNELDGQSSVIDVPPILHFAPVYFGFLSDVGISKVTVQDNPGDTEADNWYLDNVSHSAITPLMDIDIKPGEFPNPINPRNRGVIPVAILTTDTFNTTTVKATTVRFGATGTEAGPVRVAVEDVNNDGRPDLLLFFNTQDTGIQCQDTSASLTGQTFSGQEIEGSDAITTVGCR
jgi:hypothetical protein